MNESAKFDDIYKQILIDMEKQKQTELEAQRITMEKQKQAKLEAIRMSTREFT